VKERGDNVMLQRKTFMLALLVVFSLFPFLFSSFVSASESPTLISVASDPYPWERVEVYGSNVSQMISEKEKMLRISLPENDKVRSWFPSDVYVHVGYSSSNQDYDFGSYGYLKSNRYFVLGYGLGWKEATKPYPVLLVHGAADDMNRAWAHPWDKETPSSIDKPGLMQYLAERGYAVFAISFPHTHGNNLFQGQLIADAISIIKEKTGAAKVDIVAHSKGNISSIAYMSSLNDDWSDTAWMTNFRGDVRKYVAIAAPFKGLDTMFRYYLANTNTIDGTLNAPVAFYNAYIYYNYRNYYRWSMTDTYGDGNYFEGQTQLLHNWVDDPNDPVWFNFESDTGDFNNTRNKLYWGGCSYYVCSEGINIAIANSNGQNGTSNFIEKMNKKGLDPEIQFHVLYGTNQALDYYWFGYPIGEKAAPSDGLLFVKSATYTDGMTKRGATLKAMASGNYHHLDIARVTPVLNWIEKKLSEP
jgi:triacylglycerol lipase